MAGTHRTDEVAVHPQPLVSGETLSIPIRMIRGGTSKGVYLHEQDMPADTRQWGPLLLAMFGSGDGRQIDGLGGADALTSKCCIIGPPSRPDVDLDYTFAQVGISDTDVWWHLNCGNLSSGVGVFAIDEGLVKAADDVTPVRVYQTNTNSVIRIDVPTVDGAVKVGGRYAIDGVPGTGCRISVDLSETEGATLGRGVCPTGHRFDELYVEGLGRRITCSILDLATLCVFFRASDVGLVGNEGPDDSEKVYPIAAAVRASAQALLGMPTDSLNPFPIMIAPDQPPSSSTANGDLNAEADFSARIQVLPKMHAAFMGTAGCCTAVAALMSDTVVAEAYDKSTRTKESDTDNVAVRHPAGVMYFDASVIETESGPKPTRASFGRTARSLMSGTAYVHRAKIAAFAASLDPGSATISGVPSRSSTRNSDTSV